MITKEQIEREALECWPNSKDAFIAGAVFRQSEIDKLVRALKVAREGVFLDKHREDELNYILKKYE